MLYLEVNKSGHHQEYDTEFDYVLCIEGVTEDSIVLTVEEVIQLGLKLNEVIEQVKDERMEMLHHRKQKYLKAIETIDIQIKELTK